MTLLAITHRRLLADGERSLLALARAWSSAGVQHIQLREKDLSGPALRSLASRVAGALSSSTRLWVNVAHLAPGEQQAAQLWAPALHFASLPPFTPAVPWSAAAHTAAEATAARDRGAQLVVFAPVWEKPLWPPPAIEAVPPSTLPGVGLAALRDAVAAARPVPVYALGGITPGNASLCLREGAAGIAGIRLFAGEGWRALVSARA